MCLLCQDEDCGNQQFRKEYFVSDNSFLGLIVPHSDIIVYVDNLSISLLNRGTYAEGMNQFYCGIIVKGGGC